MTKVLVLGKNGMLGSMVFDYLAKNAAFHITGTERNEFDVEEFLKDPSKFSKFKNFNYVINCIGIIKPYCQDNDPEGVIKAIRINSLFPYELAKFYNKSSTKIIQIATDCVFSGFKGGYDEISPHDPLDVYGTTKSLGEVLTGNFLNIRCSIIGPEVKNNLGLFGWFLSQKKNSKISGYDHHIWNGVTTLQFTKLCRLIIEKGEFSKLTQQSHIFHFVPNNTLSKYDLLILFNKIFKKGLQIEKVDHKEKKDMSLKTKYKLLSDLFGKSSIEKALMELKDYIANSETYKY